MARLGDVRALTPVGSEQLIKSLVEPVVASQGCELWHMSISGPHGRRLLRVFIDAPGGVDLERCSRVSRTLRPMLDASPDLADVDLEVSSPGAERPLRGMDDYRRHTGSRVNLRFRPAPEGEDGGAEVVVEGVLQQVDDRELTVMARGDRPVVVPVESIIEARLAVDFGGDDRPPRNRR
ncbi:MAG: ribosome maturation factor RimP [Candidatus Dormibacteraeota bacterium]|nr:ribosome maturation factor RimP [Candidatus Dormibacteraeota bacterium]